MSRDAPHPKEQCHATLPILKSDVKETSYRVVHFFSNLRQLTSDWLSFTVYPLKEKRISLSRVPCPMWIMCLIWGTSLAVSLVLTCLPGTLTSNASHVVLEEVVVKNFLSFHFWCELQSLKSSVLCLLSLQCFLPILPLNKALFSKFISWLIAFEIQCTRMWSSFFLLEIRTEFLLEITFYWYETFKVWLLPDDEYYKWLYIKLILSTNFISWRISKLSKSRLWHRSVNWLGMVITQMNNSMNHIERIRLVISKRTKWKGILCGGLSYLWVTYFMQACWSLNKDKLDWWRNLFTTVFCRLCIAS